MLVDGGRRNSSRPDHLFYFAHARNIYAKLGVSSRTQSPRDEPWDSCPRTAAPTAELDGFGDDARPGRRSAGSTLCALQGARD